MATEDELADRIRAKDEAALVEFVELKKLQLLAFITRSLSDALGRKVEPTDILQESMVSAVASLDEIELGDRDPFNWLCQLAERRIIDAHRRHFGAQKRSAHREVGLNAPSSDSGQGLVDLLAASMTSPSKAFSRGQREFHLLAALDQLPDDNREALKLRYVDGLPSKEIAEKLGRSDGAVRVLLTRSLKKLQELLADNSAFASFINPQQ